MLVGNPVAIPYPWRTWPERLARAVLFVRGAVEFSRQPAAEASSPAPHAERVSISDTGREASRGADRPALGDVRWYKAVRRGAVRTGGTQADHPAWPAGSAASAPAPSQPVAARNARAAIAAYLANMPLAA